MADVTTYTYSVVTQIQEETDSFIFSVIQPFCEQTAKCELSKEDLRRACTLLLAERNGQIEMREAGKWIPVTERLPEKADIYLVTCLDESGVYAGLVEFVECAYWTGLRWQKDCDDLEDVIAWMSLPEPYKEEENETNS